MSFRNIKTHFFSYSYKNVTEIFEIFTGSENYALKEQTPLSKY